MNIGYVFDLSGLLTEDFSNIPREQFLYTKIGVYVRTPKTVNGLLRISNNE